MTRRKKEEKKAVGGGRADISVEKYEYFRWHFRKCGRGDIFIIFLDYENLASGA